jgi:hypothetical protein
LPGLAAGVERTRDLGAAEGAVGEETAIFARKRNALLDALIDDGVGDFGEAINVRFPRTKIATLNCVVEKAINAVAIVRVILGRVDSALSSDAVSAAWAVLVTERFDVVTLLAKRGGGRSAGQTGPDDNDLETATIVRGNETGIILVPAPFFRQRAGRNLGFKRADHE